MSQILKNLQAGPLLEQVLFAMVRNAIGEIRKQRTYHSVKAKMGYAGEMDDVCTSADLAAQEAYTRAIRVLFPDYGIIAEEEGMRIACSRTFGEEQVYFTIDPLDGTKAFLRKQSSGIGTMVSLVRGDEVIATCIGDVMTQELYSQPPEDPGAWQIDMANQRVPLVPETSHPLSKQFALIRGRPEDYSTLIRRMLDLPANRGLCKSYQTVDGSIGLSMARMWNGEFGIAIQPETTMTSWDATPVIGMNRRLDILQLQESENGYFLSVPYRLPTANSTQPETVYVHRKLLEEFMTWQYKTFELYK